MKPDLRTNIEVALLVANVPHPYEVAEVVLEAIKKHNEPEVESQGIVRRYAMSPQERESFIAKRVAEIEHQGKVITPALERK